MPSFYLPVKFHFLKGATKSNFTHYSCVVIVLFNTSLYRSAFSTVSFGKLFFKSFCVFCVFCFESTVLNQDIKICVIMLCKLALQFCYVFCFVLTLYKNPPFINTKLFIKILSCKNMLSERFCIFQKSHL